METIDYWNRFNTRQRAIEKRFIGSVHLAIKKQYISFLNAVRTRGYEHAKNNIDTIVSPEGIVKALKKMYRYAAWIEGNYVVSSLIRNSRKSLITSNNSVELLDEPIRTKRLPTTATDASFGIGFDEIAGVVDEYFRLYQLNISALPITETTRKHILKTILDKIDEGKTLDQALGEFREIAITGTNNRSRTRALGIMQTESTRAMSFGGLIGAYKSGVDVDKVWVTCADEKVRTRPYSHALLDGQATGLFRAFNNGEAIKFPGDPDASIENTARCRCAQYFREKRRARPRLIRPRSLQRFLTDFFTGFFIGSEILESLLTESE